MRSHRETALPARTASTIGLNFHNNEVCMETSEETPAGGRGGSHNTGRAFGAVLASVLAVTVGSSGYNTFVAESSSTTSASYTPLTFLLLFVWCLTKFVTTLKTQSSRIVFQVDDVVTRVSSSQALERIRSSMSASSMRLVELANGRGGTAERTLEISGKDSFVCQETLAALSLSDMKDLMQFVAAMNHLSFQKEASLESLRAPARATALEICKVLLRSRGKTIAISTPAPRDDGGVGDMDALAFTAFCRVFAEWRSVRLVPEGHKGYAVGMGLAKRDLIQNAQKIETAVHSYMADSEQGRTAAVELANGRQLSSPTIKQLLLWEKKQGLHTRLPKLADKSGAIGLLWIQRQLQYQTSIFQNLAEVPTEYLTAQEAVAAAYTSTYEEYHGFFVKQIFRKSIDAAPGAEEILEHMNAPLERQDSCTEASSKVSDESSKTATDTNTSDTASSPQIPSSIVTGDPRDLNPLDQLGNHIAEEWMKLERFLNQCKGFQDGEVHSRNLLQAPTLDDLDGLSTVPSIACAPSKASIRSEKDIATYLAVAQPVLTGLDSLLSELNMKDPSRC